MSQKQTSPSVRWPSIEGGRVKMLKPANGQTLIAVMFDDAAAAKAHAILIAQLEAFGYRRYGGREVWVVDAKTALAHAPPGSSPSAAMMFPLNKAPGVFSTMLLRAEWEAKFVVLPKPQAVAPGLAVHSQDTSPQTTLAFADAPAPLRPVVPEPPVVKAQSLGLRLAPNLGRTEDGAFAVREGGAWRRLDLDMPMDRVAALIARRPADVSRIVDQTMTALTQVDAVATLEDFQTIARMVDEHQPGAFAHGVGLEFRRRFDLTRPESLLSQAERVQREAPRISDFLVENGGLPIEAMIFLERLTAGALRPQPDDEIFSLFAHQQAETGVASTEGAQARVETQAFDLSRLGADAANLYQAIDDELRARDEHGRSLFVLDAEIDDTALTRLLGHVGREYGVESAVRFDVAGFARTFVAVGRRRPGVELAAPEASLRIGQARNVAEAFEAGGAALVARRKIAAFLDEAEKAEEPRQQPYRPLSSVGVPKTMLPVALQAAQQKALEGLRMFMEPYGGVDAWLARSLDVEIADLDLFFSPEQIDAIGLSWKAISTGRAFLNEDATGIGKGRSMAGAAALWVRSGEGRKVIYLTESGEINAPDVLRDLRDSGRLADFRIAVVANNCAPGVVDVGSLPKPKRDELFASQSFGDANLVMATYSQFNREESAAFEWAKGVVDSNTMIILDEAHNALNADARTGKNIQEILEQTGAQLFATATPLRPNSKFSLYRRLLPPRHRAKIEDLGSFSIETQEVLSTMLVEDGVAIRRDHDFSNLTIRQDLPDAERHAWLEEQIGALQPIIRGILAISAETKAHMADVNRDMRGAMRVEADFRRLDPAARERADRAIDQRLGKLNGNAQVFGPLEQIVGAYMTAIKLTPPRPGDAGPMGKSQMLLAVEDAIARGRKPILSLKMTYESMLTDWRDAHRDTASPPRPTFKSLALRAINRFFMVKVNGVKVDLRESANEATAQRFQALWAAAQNAIAGVRDDIPVSMIDALRQQLARAGVTSSEVTGRSLQLNEDGSISRRLDVGKRGAIDAFNEGEVEAIVINAAGSTGGSMHASPLFKDQRPRTKLELELDTDIVKHIQGIGRANRYNQLHGLEIITLLTGALPEVRRASIANSKLSKLGAVVEANRDHPLRDASTPDMVNAVGDRVAFSWLTRNPAVSSMLEIEIPVLDEADDPTQMPSDSLQKIHGLMNRLLSRMIVVESQERERFFQSLCEEFSNMIEELDSRNENPLRPRRLPGRIEIRSSEVFSGVDNADADLSVSAFDSAVHLSKAVYKTSARALDGRAAMRLIEDAARQDRGVGRAAAERLRALRDDELRMHLPHGVAPTPEAIAQSQVATNVAQRIDDIAEMLEKLTPGRIVMTTDNLTGELRQGVVVSSVPASDFNLASNICNGVTLVWPGSIKPERFSFTRLKNDKAFAVGDTVFELDSLDEVQAAFSRESGREFQRPAMVLTGNLFDAETFGRANKLGSATIFQDERGEWRRGVVVTNDERFRQLRDAPVQMKTADALLYFISASARAIRETIYEGGAPRTPAAQTMTRLPSNAAVTLAAPFGQEGDGLLLATRVAPLAPGRQPVFNARRDAGYVGVDLACVIVQFKLPSFSTKNAWFWRSDAGRSLWPFITGGQGEQMPERFNGRSFPVCGVQLSIPAGLVRVDEAVSARSVEDLIDVQQPQGAVIAAALRAATDLMEENNIMFRYVGAREEVRADIRNFVANRIVAEARREYAAGTAGAANVVDGLGQRAPAVENDEIDRRNDALRMTG